MRIAITNIVINAINAMAAGKGELTLITKAIDQGYVLQIEDNGCGVSKDELKNIFRPLFKKKAGRPWIRVGSNTRYPYFQSRKCNRRVRTSKRKPVFIVI
ncbi:ATP-binding protein [Niabella insulamsoli]|uniref:ATP-binding protein n=1 Tax=Niabella insulamsoli TaxID=3144874 RepID=UPI0031FE127E